MKKSILIFTLFIFFISCVFKLENETHKDGESFLTITSDFTDVAGEQVVNLQYSSNKTSYDGHVINVSDAEVSISDDQNNVINFKQSDPGKYISATPGIPDRKYTLKIKLSNGKKYHSLPEIMPLAPEIQKLYYKFEEEDFRKDYKKRYGYNVYIDFIDSPEQGDFYQWKWDHYEIDSICATCLKNKRYDNNNQLCKNISLSPNNDNANSDGLNYFKCNASCWNISRSDGFNLLSDIYYNGQNINGVRVHRAEFKSLPSEYYLKIHQRKINKSSYLYLKALETQLKTNGTFFDIPSQTQFNFNVFSDDDPKEKIIGVFNVYSFKTKIISIPINQVINGMTPEAADPFKIFYKEDFLMKNVYADCINGSDRTSKEPEGWKY